MEEPQRHLRAFDAFLRALFHRVRTPLNVVSNELAYLTEAHASEDLERARKRCREIAELIRGYDLGNAFGSRPAGLDLVGLPDGTRSGVAADSESRPHLFSRAQLALERVSAAVPMRQLSAVQTRGGLTLICESVTHLSVADCNATALHEIVSRIGAEEPEAAFFDLLWWALGGTIDAQVYGGKLTVKLTLPFQP